jgi:hypothetical protein
MRQLIFVSAIIASVNSTAFAESAAPAEKAAPAAESAKVTTKTAAAIVDIEGTVVKVVAKKKEIYVKDAAGKKHEFYFTDKTTLTSAGAPAEFSTLKEGSNVKVSAEKHGKRLKPVAVEIR